MTFFVQILTVAAVVLALGLLVLLVENVHDDGYRRSARRLPPRSHPVDPFDPGSRFA